MSIFLKWTAATPDNSPPGEDFRQPFMGRKLQGEESTWYAHLYSPPISIVGLTSKTSGR